MHHSHLLVVLAALVGMDWQRFLDALRLSGTSMKAAAIVMDLSDAQLSRQVRGQERMHVDRVAQLPTPFHQWYALLTLQAVGLPTEVARSVRPALALLGRKRMASMSDATVAERRVG